MMLKPPMREARAIGEAVSQGDTFALPETGRHYLQSTGLQPALVKMIMNSADNMRLYGIESE